MIPRPVVFGHIKPAGHGLQVDSPSSEYIPGEQADFPTLSLVLQAKPAGHFVHVTAPSSEISPIRQSSTRGSPICKIPEADTNCVHFFPIGHLKQ